MLHKKGYDTRDKTVAGDTLYSNLRLAIKSNLQCLEHAIREKNQIKIKITRDQSEIKNNKKCFVLQVFERKHFQGDKVIDKFYVF